MGRANKSADAARRVAGLLSHYRLKEPDCCAASRRLDARFQVGTPHSISICGAGATADRVLGTRGFGHEIPEASARVGMARFERVISRSQGPGAIAPTHIGATRARPGGQIRVAVWSAIERTCGKKGAPGARGPIFSAEQFTPARKRPGSVFRDRVIMKAAFLRKTVCHLRIRAQGWQLPEQMIQS